MCEKLKCVELNEGLETLGTDEKPDDKYLYHGVFEGSAIEKIGIPSTLKRIEYSTFEGCKSLTAVEFGTNCQLEKIRFRAFENIGLEEFVAPPSLRIIGYAAFYKCAKLKRVVLNEGLETLGENEPADGSSCFRGIFEESGVQEVFLPSTLKVIERRSF